MFAQLDFENRTEIEQDVFAPDGSDWLDAKHWVRNENDELAIENGCWFDPERAAWACWWMESQLKLYEGEWAGAPIRFLSTAHDPTYYDETLDKKIAWDIPSGYPAAFEDALPIYLDRMRRHNQLYAEGRFMHWHAETVFQVYGWVRVSNDSRWRDPQTNEKAIVRRFTKAVVFCAKKNGKSPFTAANGLYLLCGDGEGGGSIAFAASDLQQAKNIIGAHAFQMVAQSATLREECKTNKNECKIEDLVSRSRMFPLSAGNEKSANSQHGLNLHGGIIDEVHVCNRRIHDRMGRAFRSRKQPLLLEVSTAGDNPESWGKTEFDKGVKIATGQIKNDSTFVAIHAAPQNLSDKQIHKNIERYIRMANPALGHIVSMEQTLRDYQDSRHTAADFNLFKYEILNIWTNASTAWLNPGIYSACGGWKMEKDDYSARMVIGFDNARKKDLASAVMSWEYWFDPRDVNIPLSKAEQLDESLIRPVRGCMQIPLFWTNSERLEELLERIPKMAKWVKLGYIRVHEGNTIEQFRIARDLAEIVERNNCIGMVCDPWHCDLLTEYLTMGVTDPTGKIAVQPCLQATQVIEMRQSFDNQAGPTVDYEIALKQQLIGHTDHPVLSWQFGHANVSHDKNGNLKVQKESEDSFRSVDGVQAAIMSHWGLLQCRDFQNKRLDFYERNPLEFL